MVLQQSWRQSCALIAAMCRCRVWVGQRFQGWGCLSLEDGSGIYTVSLMIGRSVSVWLDANVVPDSVTDSSSHYTKPFVHPRVYMNMPGALVVPLSCTAGGFLHQALPWPTFVFVAAKMYTHMCVSGRALLSVLPSTLTNSLTGFSEMQHACQCEMHLFFLLCGGV